MTECVQGAIEQLELHYRAMQKIRERGCPELIWADMHVRALAAPMPLPSF